MYQYLSTRHDWPVRNLVIVDLPVRMKGNSKSTSINLSSPLGAHNMYLDTASQTNTFELYVNYMNVEIFSPQA